MRLTTRRRCPLPPPSLFPELLLPHISTPVRSRGTASSTRTVPWWPRSLRRLRRLRRLRQSRRRQSRRRQSRRRRPHDVGSQQHRWSLQRPARARCGVTTLPTSDSCTPVSCRLEGGMSRPRQPRRPRRHPRHRWHRWHCRWHLRHRRHRWHCRRHPRHRRQRRAAGSLSPTSIGTTSWSRRRRHVDHLSSQSPSPSPSLMAMATARRTTISISGPC